MGSRFNLLDNNCYKITTIQTDNIPKHHTNFETEWDLINTQGNWLGSSFPHYSDWVQRIKDLYPFLYLASRFKYAVGSVLAKELWLDQKDTSLDINFPPQITTSDAQYVLNKFLQTIQTGYQNE